MSVASDIYNRLRKAGLTEAGAAGLMGNLKAESGLKSTNVEDILEPKIGYNDETYTAAVDSGKITRAQFLNPISGKQYGYGLAQWTSPGRKAGLYDLCKSKGKSIGDLETQIEWLLTELKTSYSGVFKTLTSTTDVRTASNAVLTKFEMPADTGASVQETRYQYSMQYYNEFATGGKVVSIHYISNSGHDENNGYTGGKAGDQTGGEWELRSWYNRPWDCVLRHPNAKVQALLAELATKAANNNKIGYDQGQRDTYWQQLQKVGYDPSKITTACEADCSAGVIANVKAAGYLLGIDALKNVNATYTGNMKSGFKAAGFTVLTESKYLTSPDYLLPGDILLNEVHHTATNITKGSKANGSASANASAQSNLYGDCSIPAHWFLKGAVHPEIKSIQRLLNAKGFKGKDGKKLKIDGELGDNTAYAIEQLQRKAGLPASTNWGTVAGKTWSLLLN